MSRQLKGCSSLFRFILFALLLLLLCCNNGWIICVVGKKDVDVNGVESVTLFDASTACKGALMDEFSFPSLAAVSDTLLAFAEHLSIPQLNPKLKYKVSVKYTQRKGDKWNISTLSGWKTQNPADNTIGGDGGAPYGLRYPTTVVKGHKIYILMHYELSPINYFVNTGDLQLIMGRVQQGGGKNSRKTINWKPPVSLTDTLINELKGNSLNNMLRRGNCGIVTRNRSVVFPAMIRKNVSHSYPALIHSCDRRTKNWNISKGKTAVDCFDPSIAELEAGKFLMMSSCKDNRRKVFESSDMGETWTEASATLSRVWQNPDDRNHYNTYAGLIAATLQEGNNNKKVMLLTVPVHSVNEGANESQLHLWMSDAENRHIYNVGPVSAEDAAASALLYTKDHELFTLYESYSQKENTLGAYDSLQLARLTGKLDQVKSVLRTWEEVDRRVSAPCNAAGHTDGGKTCRTPMPTSGLVGFLSGNATENEWRDEYLCVDARVTGETVKNTNDGGLTFQGSDSWAEWPVSNQGQTQRYHFANYNFTLMATVAIHSEPTEAAGSIPLMGVKLNCTDEKKTLMGLSYTADNKWEVTLNGEKKTTTQGEKTWELNKEYQVTLILRDGNKGSVYIDGERLGNEGADLKMDDGTISHFYIGGDGQGSTGSADSSNRVSVKNVLLYNRPLTDEEISTPKVKGTPVSQPSGSEHPTSQTSVETSTNVFTNGSLKTSMPRGDNSECVHVSGVLLLFLLSLGLLGTVV